MKRTILGSRLHLATALCALLVAGAARAEGEPAIPAGSTGPLKCLGRDQSVNQLLAIRQARADLPEAEQARVERVAGLLAPLAQVAGLDWPPTVEVISESQPNAFAFCYQLSGQSPQGMIILTAGLLRDVIQGSDARLAGIMGHEMGHLALHHVRAGGDDTASRYFASFYQRGSESEADVYGFALALNAGFAFKDVLGGMRRFYDLYPTPPASCTQCDHPTPVERLALLDRSKARLWRAVSAFDSGTFFAAAGSFEEAARLFRSVTAQFPESWEAHANLGYALLMQYADGLPAAEFRRLHVGHLAMGSYYLRADSALKQLEVRPHLREQAVEALQTALRLNPRDPVALANLGVAHLVDPAGNGAKTAVTLLARALRLSRGRLLQEVAPIQINLAVAYDAAGNRTGASKTLASAIDDFGGVGGIDLPALQYGAGMWLAGSKAPGDRGNGLALLEEYLGEIGTSAWWDLAYDRYALVSGQAGRRALSREELRQARPTRQVVAVRWADDKHVALADPVEQVRAQLGERPASHLTPDQGALVRYSYPERGSEIIASDVVLAVILRGAKAPALELRAQGLGGPQVGAVRIGMPAAEVKRLLGGAAGASRILSGARFYAIYPALNLALAFDGGQVSEVVVVRSDTRG